MAKNGLSNIFGSGGFLRSPGDKAEVRITPTGRGVGKVSTNGGKEKYSETHYPNGTVVKTYSKKK